MQTRFPSLSRLLFGDTQALVQRNFQALADQSSHVAPTGNFDSAAKDNVIHKGVIFALPGLVFNHSINSHLIAQTDLTQYGLSLMLYGQSRVVLPQQQSCAAILYDALLSPPYTILRFETSPSQLTSSLHITFDLKRLNRISLAMQGGNGIPMVHTHLRTVKLQHGHLNLRQLFYRLTQEIDGFARDAELLRAAGFEDRVYRLLAMTLQPEIFLKDYLSVQEQRQLQSPHWLAAFESHVEANLEETLRLTDIEKLLGVSSRAMQYACMKKHGCSPSTYIRNKKLDYAYALLRQKGNVTTLAELAARLHFSSQSQFARYFRERFDILPSALKTD